jgi:hypothetical protein
MIKDFLRQYCPLLTSMFAIKETLGSGSNGEAYLLEDGSVLKVSALIDWAHKELDIREEYAQIWWILRQIKQEQPIHLVKLHDLGVIACGRLPEKQNYTIYYYRMERLFPLTEDETKVFQTVISHEDRHLIKHFKPKELDSVLKGLDKGLEFSAERVRTFYQQIQASKFRHLDLHQRNIMKTAEGEYRLIDLDRMKTRIDYD